MGFIYSLWRLPIPACFTANMGCTHAAAILIYLIHKSMGIKTDWCFSNWDIFMVICITGQGTRHGCNVWLRLNLLWLWLDQRVCLYFNTGARASNGHSRSQGWSFEHGLMCDYLHAKLVKYPHSSRTSSRGSRAWTLPFELLNIPLNVQNVGGHLKYYFIQSSHIMQPLHVESSKWALCHFLQTTSPHWLLEITCHMLVTCCSHKCHVNQMLITC